MRRLSVAFKRDVLLVAAFVAGSSVAIAAVVVQARRDSADPSRCAGLVALGTRCCAAGQHLVGGQCVGRPSRCPKPLEVTDGGCVAQPVRVALAGGHLRVGAGDWEAEGRIRPHDVEVAAFQLDAFEITESAYATCVEAGRCPARPMTGEPGRALGGLSQADVEAYCTFRGGRLPTADEWTFAAAGRGARRYPWGDTGAVCRRGAWGLADGPCGFGFAQPELAGAHADGATPEGIHDLAGNVAEWVRDAPLEPREASFAGVEPGSTAGFVRGGSFATALATDLRTWHVRPTSRDAHPSDAGGRCAYDALEPSRAASSPAP
jgi:formylglycine-generating enzyme required for sulfatase activity